MNLNFNIQDELLFKNTIQVTNENYPIVPCYKLNERLIDLLAIIGFESDFIIQELPFNFELINKNFEPTILSYIKPNPNLEVMDNQTLISICFGKYRPTWIKSDVEPLSYENVFYMRGYYGYCYIFYENYSSTLFNNMAEIDTKFSSNVSFTAEQLNVLSNLWIPKAIIILSLYPCFSSYNNICKEIILSCLVNDKKMFDLNKNNSKKYSKSSFIIDNNIKNLDNSNNFIEYSNEYTKNTINFDKYSNYSVFDNTENKKHDIFNIEKNSFNCEISNIIKNISSFLEIELYNLVYFTPPPIVNGYNINFMSSSIKIPQLNLYPLIDYNIIKIISILPIKEFIKVCLYALIEIDIFVYCENIELLNLFNLTLMNLMYPLFENPQFERIVVLDCNFDNINDEHPFAKFIFNPFSIILGINSKLSVSLESIFKVRCKDALIVDLNEKTCCIINDKEDYIMEEIHLLLEEIVDNSSKNIQYIEYKNIFNESNNYSTYNYFTSLIKDKGGKTLFNSIGILQTVIDILYLKLSNILKLNNSSNTYNNDIVYNERSLSSSLYFTSKNNLLEFNSEKNLKQKHTKRNNNKNSTLLSFNENLLNFKRRSLISYCNNKNTNDFNKDIQEIFYDFMLNLMSILYQNYNLDNSLEKKEYKYFSKIDDKNISEIETNFNYIIKTNKDFCFWNHLKNQNLKFQNFFNEYLMGNSKYSVDKHCILSYQFTEEFIYLKISSKLKYNNVNYFDIIDKFYFFKNKHNSKVFKDLDFSVLQNDSQDFIAKYIYDNIEYRSDNYVHEYYNGNYSDRSTNYENNTNDINSINNSLSYMTFSDLKLLSLRYKFKSLFSNQIDTNYLKILNNNIDKDLMIKSYSHTRCLNSNKHSNNIIKNVILEDNIDTTLDINTNSINKNLRLSNNSKEIYDLNNISSNDILNSYNNQDILVEQNNYLNNNFNTTPVKNKYSSLTNTYKCSVDSNDNKNNLLLIKYANLNKLDNRSSNNSNINNNNLPNSDFLINEVYKSNKSMLLIVSINNKLLNEYSRNCLNNKNFNILKNILINHNLVKINNQRYYIEELVDFIEYMYIEKKAANIVTMLKLSYLIIFILTRKDLEYCSELFDLNEILEYINNNTDLLFIRKYINLILIHYNKNYLLQKDRFYKIDYKVNNSPKDNLIRNIFVVKIANYIKYSEIIPNSIMNFVLCDICDNKNSIDYNNINNNSNECNNNFKLSDSNMKSSTIIKENYKTPLILKSFCACGFKKLANLTGFMTIENDLNYVIEQENKDIDINNMFYLNKKGYCNNNYYGYKNSENLEDNFINFNCNKCKIINKEIKLILKFDKSNEIKCNIYSPLKILNECKRLIINLINNCKEELHLKNSITSCCIDKSTNNIDRITDKFIKNNSLGLNLEDNRILLEILVNMLLYNEEFKLEFSKRLINNCLSKVKKIIDEFEN